MKPIKVPTNNTIERIPRKLQYYIEDEQEVVDDFERMVKEKYGFLRGIIGHELIKALKLYMSCHDFECYSDVPMDTLIQKADAHTTPLLDNKKLLAGYIYDNFFSGDRITFRELQDIIIKNYRRTDRRTHRSYVDTLEVNEILCRCPGIDRYDYYYFKEVPKLSTLEELNGDVAVLYSHIPISGRISINELGTLSGWKKDKVIVNLKKLKNKGLIKLPVHGKVEIVEGGG